MPSLEAWGTLSLRARGVHGDRAWGTVISSARYWATGVWAVGVFD